MFMSCYCTIVNIKYVIDLININDNKLNDGFLNILLYAAGKLCQGGLLWSSTLLRTAWLHNTYLSKCTHSGLSDNELICAARMQVEVNLRMNSSTLWSCTLETQ